MRPFRLLAAAAALAALAWGLAPAGPAAASVTGQCDPTHTCLNVWNLGLYVNTYQGYAANNAIVMHWLGNGTFELRTAGGGCLGDAAGSRYSSRAGAGNSCPSSGTADWGTVFQLIQEPSLCGGYARYWNNHWRAFIGFADGTGHAVSLDSTGNCLLQQAA